MMAGDETRSNQGRSGMAADRLAWTRRVIVGLVIAALVVGFVGRHGGAVLASFALAFAALAVGLLSLPDGDPEVD